jgi:hypothetical protein
MNRDFHPLCTKEDRSGLSSCKLETPTGFAFVKGTALYLISIKSGVIIFSKKYKFNK